MIYSVTTKNIAKGGYTISIENMPTSMEHWCGDRSFIDLAEEFELGLIRSSLEADIVDILLKLLGKDKRIVDISFFEGDKLLLVSNIRNFNPDNFLKRSIKMDFSKYNRTFEIFEIHEDEKERALPEDWKPVLDLTNKLNKYQQLFLC